jgi:hypothetical protein
MMGQYKGLGKDVVSLSSDRNHRLQQSLSQIYSQTHGLLFIGIQIFLMNFFEKVVGKERCEARRARSRYNNDDDNQLNISQGIF